jgi:soluble lytic murein transglycosylase
MDSEGDRRAAELMVAYAVDMRRKDSPGEALNLLSGAMTKYPFISEDALWQTGWTHYMGGEYERAVEVFSGLHESYQSSKYLYWKARAIEKTGSDATELYASLEDTGYYGLLAVLRTERGGPVTVGAEDPKALRPMKRADLLMEAGLKEEAEMELLKRAEEETAYQDLINIAFRLKDLGLYREAMLTASRVPEELRPQEVLYPLAYWPIIKEASANFGIDPVLLLSLMREESRFDPQARSRAGALGLMQLMPETAGKTASDLRLSLNGNQEIYDIEVNIALGAHHLGGLIREFGSVPAALAAYNAGARRVRQWLEDGRYGARDEFIEDIPFPETRNYVKRILSTYFRYHTAGDVKHPEVPRLML